MAQPKTTDAHEDIKDRDLKATQPPALSVEEDPVLDKMVLIFLVLFLLAVIFIPQEWFLKWSMWWNGIK